MNDLDKALPAGEKEGYFITANDGLRLFVYDHRPPGNYSTSLFIISGITGINHHSEKDIISQLGNNRNRIVVMHPRGTGYSEGKRGDITVFPDFIDDYTRLVAEDNDYRSRQHKIVLFGHSMSTAVALAVAAQLENLAGLILVNPPYILKKAKGMSPGLADYMKYAWHFLFNRHQPVVNMAGDPASIENPADRQESEQRKNDPLLVSHFSMQVMTASGKLMKAMPEYCRKVRAPLLLLYGEKDAIVDKTGCDLLFREWPHEKKQYVTVKDGSHGKSTVKAAKEIISTWLEQL